MAPRAATVLHVDLDAFFVSMELLRRPGLRGQPVVVGYLGNRGVVSTCSYEARAFGVRSAMPVAQARRLCPQATYIEPDFSLYAPASKAFHAILREFTPLVEPAGADEAYLDVRGSERLFGEPATIGETIRARVRGEIGITASVGISVNKLVSKVASDAAKPDGLLVVARGTEAEFLAPRPVRELPTVGPKTAAALNDLGIRTIGQLAGVPVDSLRARFGRHGEELHARALGEFEAPVLAGHGAAKSISAETTFDVDVSDESRLLALLNEQSSRVAAELARQGRSARTVALKLRFPPFETLTRASTFSGAVGRPTEIAEAATALFERAWEENGRRPVRLLGVGVANLQERAHQLRLGESVAHAELDDRLAKLREQFGPRAIRRGSEVQPGHPRGGPGS